MLRRVKVFFLGVVVLTFWPPHGANAGFEITHDNGVTQIDGSIFGAPFRMVRPDEWNGGLVLLLHGAVPENAPLTLPPVGHELFDPLSAGFVAQGYGVAYSSYRVNGYAVREGAFDTRVVEFLFSILMGRPSETYLAGVSMGTHIGQRLVERSPYRYEGYLPVCAALGGSTVQQDYFADARVLFDYFYPGTLPGNLLTADLDYFTEVIPLVVGELMSNPDPLLLLDYAATLGYFWQSPDELAEGAVAALALAGGGTMDLQRKSGGNFYDNSGRVYSGSRDDETLNGIIERFVADPRSVRYFRRYYDPNGRLPYTKVLHLHTTRDAIVPLHIHQPVYERLLQRRGYERNYVVRTFDRFGHCNVGPNELFTGFADLVQWVATDIRPQ
ncbi:MAG: hypothetical protein AAF438_10255 [Pseudomonadota bacterium]